MNLVSAVPAFPHHLPVFCVTASMAFNKSKYLGKAGLAIGSPTLRKKSSAQSWVSASEANVSRRPYGLPGIQILPRQDLTTPLGSFVQVPMPTGADLHDEAAAVADSGDYGSDSFEGDSDTSGDGSDRDALHPLVFPAEEASPRKKLDKKIALWRNWALKLIPQLLDPHLNLLRESENLKNIDRRLPCCSCNGTGYKMKVIAVFFESELLFSFQTYQLLLTVFFS